MLTEGTVHLEEVYYTWLCFRSNFNCFYEGSRVKGPIICVKIMFFGQFMTPKIEFLIKKHTFGEIVMSNIMEMCIFSEKNVCGMQNREKTD